MVRMKTDNIGLVLPLLAGLLAAPAVPAFAQDQDEDRVETVIVTGQREATVKAAVEDAAKSITRNPRIDKPLARQYGQICVGVIGLAPSHAAVMIERIEANARQLDIAVAEPDCQPNTLVIFARDPRGAIKDLRKQAPWLFESLLDYEYKRVLDSGDKTFAWHSTEMNEADGKPAQAVSLDFGDGAGKRQVKQHDPFSATRFGQQIRMDMTGSVVLIDSSAAPGKTLQQLADYASMRSFASVDDRGGEGASATSSILSLFQDGEAAPAEMTDFDWAYLDALYKLPRTAKGSAIIEAAWSAYRTRVRDDQQ